MMIGLMTGTLSACGTKSTDQEIPQTLSFSSSLEKTVIASAKDRLFKWLMPSATAESAAAAMEDKSGANVNLTSAWLSVTKIQFHGAEATEDDRAQDMMAKQDADDHSGSGDDNGGDTSTFRGPYYIDLLSDEPVPVDTQSLKVQEYRRIRMKLHKVNAQPPAGVPNEIRNNSVYLAGTVNGVNFSYIADDTTYMNINGPDAVLPEEQKDLLVTFKIADMISKIDLSSITSTTAISHDNRVPATNPCPEIHPTANDLYMCFRKGLEMQAKLGQRHK